MPVMDKRKLLAQCEKEPLHLSGAIQPHGTLLVVDAQGYVSHVADNIDKFLGTPPALWLDNPLSPELTSMVSDIGSSPGSRKTFRQHIEGRTGMLDVLIHRGVNGECVLEFLPHLNMAEPVNRQLVPPLLHPPENETELAAARQQLVEEIAILTGFQRVMYYHFLEDGDGEVVAEARRSDVFGSYLGLRFPASDIPQIARNLYLKNPWRFIPDATAKPVPIHSRDGQPPDLTWSDLRSVSPVHIIYLQNMGVTASLSYPVVVNGTLIALVAAHHHTSHQLALDILEEAASRVRAHALAYAGYQSQCRMRFIDSLPYRMAPVEEILRRNGGIIAGWHELANWIQKEFSVDGVVLCDGELILTSGITLSGKALEVVDEWFCDQQNSLYACTDSLIRLLPGFPLSEVAGIMALQLSVCSHDSRGRRLYLTRSEHIYEVAWGGNPDKPVEWHDGELGIAPRRSFERWIEKRLGYCRPWSNETRLLAYKLREVLGRW